MEKNANDVGRFSAQSCFFFNFRHSERSCKNARHSRWLRRLNVRASKPHNSLSKLLFSPDWTIVMLSWRAFPHVLSSLCNWSRMQQPEWSLMNLFIRLHWLPIAARIKFKVLMFAYKTTTGAAPIYLNLLVQTYAPSRSLRSASERSLVVPSQRGTKSLSQTFSWTVPSWWNDLPISIRTAESLAIFKKHLKTHLFRQHLTN